MAYQVASNAPYTCKWAYTNYTLCSAECQSQIRLFMAI